jgi:hypothetical protein
VERLVSFPHPPWLEKTLLNVVSLVICCLLRKTVANLKHAVAHLLPSDKELALGIEVA